MEPLVGAQSDLCSHLCSCFRVQNQSVAIKKISGVFHTRSLNDSKRILRELVLLRHLGGHGDITWIQDIMVYPNQRDFRDVYIVSDLMEGDLAGVVSSQQTLSDAQMKYFVYQLLRGLKYVHTAGVLHRDLKPQNVLVNSDCNLKITDFGLGRAVDTDDEDQEKTPYVVTRWYVGCPSATRLFICVGGLTSCCGVLDQVPSSRVADGLPHIRRWCGRVERWLHPCRALGANATVSWP